MFSIIRHECNNPDCRVESFTYASCEPPICPACNICQACGYDSREHGYGKCPENCDDCQLYQSCTEKEKDTGTYCEKFERLPLDWGQIAERQGELNEQ